MNFFILPLCLDDDSKLFLVSLCLLLPPIEFCFAWTLSGLYCLAKGVSVSHSISFKVQICVLYYSSLSFPSGS